MICQLKKHNNWQSISLQIDFIGDIKIKLENNFRRILLQFNSKIKFQLKQKEGRINRNQDRKLRSKVMKNQNKYFLNLKES